MDEEFDTSWFDLQKYDKLSELNLEGWFSHITYRQYILNTKDVLSDGQMKRFFDKPVNHEPFERMDCESRFSFNTYSVKSTEADTFWNLAQEPELGDIWSKCEYTCDDPMEDRELVETPLNLICKSRNLYNGDDRENPHYVTIDLNASDPQIMRDFRHWLTEYRKVIGVKPKNKKFTQNTFNSWIEYRVIPYLDLIITAKIKGKLITQPQLARLIFPDIYDVDPVGRLRQVTKPEAERLMDKKTWEVLAMQLSRER